MLKKIWLAILFVFRLFKPLASSRKFQAATIAGITWAIGKIGLSLSTETLIPIVSPLWLYIFGVAIEDVGKGKAQVQAASLASLKQPAVIPADASGE